MAPTPRLSPLKGSGLCDCRHHPVSIPRIGRFRRDPLHHRVLIRLDLALDLNHHQSRADRDHITFGPGHFEHHAADRTFHLDRGLVSHHIGDTAVFLDPVANLDVPRDDFRLSDAFADIRQAEGELAHASYAFSSRSTASPMRTGPGKYAHSRLCG